MGQIQSVDPTHIGIYRKMLAIQNSATRLQMIDTLLGDPSIVYSAKQAGIYAQLLQVAAAIRHGHQPPLLPGEALQPQPKQQPQQLKQQPQQLSQTYQIHPQAYQIPVRNLGNPETLQKVQQFLQR
jgi:hypothetical protein